jgi:Zn-dependent peptidase ImmA (M78 family)
VLTVSDAEISASQVLDAYWFKTAEDEVMRPVDPIAIARKCDIQVFASIMDATGMLVPDPLEIHININDSYLRQRFTCAHELGHWQLRLNDDSRDTEPVIEYRDVLSSLGKDPKERYANAFAAALLMPKDAVQSLLDKGYTAYSVAEAFRVSVEAATYRISNLTRS